MWIFHPKGFCSVVIDKRQPGNLLCRGRVKGDLERLFPEFRKNVTESPNRDYRFRISVPRTFVAERLREMVELDISYPNFKDACPHDRHGPYLRVWNAMYNLQQDRTPRRPIRQQRAPKGGSKKRRQRQLEIEDVKDDRDYYNWLSQQPTTFCDPDREEAEAFFAQQELWR